MSYHAQVWARSLELPPAPKSVLLALAFRADINQACWPSQGRIARDTGLSERTVRRHLRWLEAQGLIARKKRFSDDGQQLSDRYVLLYGPDTVTTREDSSPAPGRSRRPQGADAGAAKYTGTDKKNLSGERKKGLNETDTSLKRPPTPTGKTTPPHLPDLSSTLAGRNVSLALYVQALDQLWESYGLNGGETILANCHHKVFHPALSLKTAQYISDNLGRVSVPEEKRSQAPGWFSPETITQGYAARPLLTSDEVRMLGPDEIIMLSCNALPIRGKRLGFPDLKVLRERAGLGPTPLHRLELPPPKPLLPAGQNDNGLKGKDRKMSSEDEPPGPKGYIDPEEG